MVFDISRVGPTVVVVMQPNRNLIVSVITETIRFRFGKWWNLKSSCSAVCFYLDKVSLAALPGCESDPDAWYRIKLARLLPGTHSLLFFPVEGSVGQYREVGWGSEGG